MSDWTIAYATQVAGNMAEALLVLDGDFKVVHANTQAANLLGVKDVESVLGMDLRDAGGERGVRFVPSFLDGEGVPIPSGLYLLSTASRKDVDVNVRILPSDGSPGAYLVLLQDATQSDRIDQRFYQSEKLAAMDNIVAGIAHELNNPMTAILGYAELLLGSETNPKRKQRIALIAEEADRCAKIIANMLSFTRSFGNAFETASVGALLEEVISLRAYQMKVDGVVIKTAIEHNLPASLVQPAAIRRLFLNVLHNAHQALLEVPKDQRKFWALAERREDLVLLELRDSGPGIADDVRYKIFDPFFTTRSLGEGMGLGLSVAYGIVHEHRGKIWMEPGEDGGTSIKIELPLDIVR